MWRTVATVGSTSANNSGKSDMLTGDIKSQIDRIWDAFWSGGICINSEFPLVLPSAKARDDFALCVAAVENLKATHRASLDALFASLQHRAFRGEL